MKGADSIAKYVPFFIGWKLKFVVLLDNDEKGKEVKDDLTKKWLVEENQIIQISPDPDNTIEDIFSHKEYFEDVLGKNSSEYDTAKSISEQLNSSKKVIAAKELSKKLKAGSIALSNGTLDKFSSIHKKIDRVFNKPHTSEK